MRMMVPKVTNAESMQRPCHEKITLPKALKENLKRSHHFGIKERD